MKQRNSHPAPVSTEEEKKQPTNKSPFTKVDNARQPTSVGKEKEEDIEEDIVQDHEDILLQQNSARGDDYVGASGGAQSSSAVGID